MNPMLTVLIVVFLGGLTGGGYITKVVMSSQIAQLESDQATALAAAQQLYRERMAAERVRGETLSSQLAQAETDLHLKTLEVSRAVQKVTRGRECFNTATVRLLNHSDHVAGPVPEAAGTPVAEGGTIATDTDVAGWIGDTQGRFETCRARLDALIDFELGRPDE